MKNFNDETNERIKFQAKNSKLARAADEFLFQSVEAKYSYNFTWLGRPVIQYPQDIVAVQEILWQVQPDLVVETGVAHGGSLVLSASMLELNAICGGPINSRVVGVDIEIRSHNRRAIEKHPLSRRIRLIEGSSTSKKAVDLVAEEVSSASRVVVMLDSNHTGEHVLSELDVYSEFVKKGGYLIVFDTIIEEMTSEQIGERPWGPGNSPMSAVREFLSRNKRFVVDEKIDAKLLVSVARNGYLKCVADPS